MRRHILIIAAILILPAATYLGWQYLAPLHPVKTLETIGRGFWSKFDLYGARISIILGVAVALKELHTTRKKKRPKAGKA